MERKKIKEALRQEASLHMGQRESWDRDTLTSFLEKVIDEWQLKKKLDISPQLKEEVIAELSADFLGWGPLDSLMQDEEVSEIMVNGPGNVYIEKNSQKVRTAVKFDDEDHLRYIIEKMLQPTGRRLDSASPYVDFSLPDGSRVNIIIPPVALGGSYVTIRKFSHTIKRIDDLVRLGTLDKRMAEFLVGCVQGGINILFSGATGVGKTTTLEVLSSYISDKERIVVIEDAPELKIDKDDVVRLVVRPSNLEGKGGISIRDLFTNSLRMRPKRIILGELRGKEALDYLQALNSGHRGSLAVIHASSAYDAVGRLEVLALYAGLNLPAWAIRKQIASGLELVVQQEQMPDGSRKIVEISEIRDIEDNLNLDIRSLFRFQIEGYTSEGKIEGRFVATGEVPHFYKKLIQQGISLSERIFQEE